MCDGLSRATDGATRRKYSIKFVDPVELVCSEGTIFLHKNCSYAESRILECASFKQTNKKVNYTARLLCDDGKQTLVN